MMIKSHIGYTSVKPMEFLYTNEPNNTSNYHKSNSFSLTLPHCCWFQTEENLIVKAVIQNQAWQVPFVNET